MSVNPVPAGFPGMLQPQPFMRNMLPELFMEITGRTAGNLDAYSFDIQEVF
ncbi:hypothetical protein ACFL6B_05505 [Thermodesulfobacteriota bacterium]